MAHIHALEAFTNSKGVVVEYKSGDFKNITGVNISIRKNRVKLSVSLHKWFDWLTNGKHRNYLDFTISEAKSAFESLLFENGFVKERVRIKYFEIGLNFAVSDDPLEFIERCERINGFKLMYIDANYRINRQKTTEKHDDIRRYFKIYDKGWEVNRKKRRAEKVEMLLSGERNKIDGQWILRIETVYKRHNENATTFFTDENIQRLCQQFHLQWRGLIFRREIRAEKGARKSEVERAREIFEADNDTRTVIARAKTELTAGRITAKQYRTISEFCRDWQSKHSYNFRNIISMQEREYRELFERQWKECRR